MDINKIVESVDPEKNYKIFQLAKTTGIPYHVLYRRVKEKKIPIVEVLEMKYVKGSDFLEYFKSTLK